MLRLLPLFAAVLALTACSDDDTTSGTPLAYEVPTTYAAFEHVSYEGQLQRLGMLGEMKAYLNSATSSTPLDSSRLAAMYANDDAATAGFSGSYSKDIKSKTFEPYRNTFNDYFGRIARISTAAAPSSQAEAGYHSSPSNGKTYLLDTNGIEYLQAIEKGLMGACFYYQATSVYLSDDRMSADNTIVTPGEGTERQHYFDEAFGYFGVPKDFPADLDGLVFWGDYCNDRNEQLQTNDIMREFLLGRAAMVNQDREAQQTAVADISRYWELVAVGSAMHYLNKAVEHADDATLRAHDLTEAVAFAKALPLNVRTAMPVTEVEDMLVKLAGSSKYADMNLYSVSDQQILEARATLAAAYGLADKANSL